MKKIIGNILVGSMVLCCGSYGVRAQDKEARDRLDNRIEAVNDAAKKPGMMDVALERISTQTGVPRDQVQALHKRFSDVRAGGLLVACVLAAETKKGGDVFLKERSGGKTWAAIARENNVPVEKLVGRLENVQKSLVTDQDKGKPKKD